MSDQSEVKILGRKQAKKLSAQQLQERTIELLADLRSDREIDLRACFTTLLEACHHLLEKDNAATS